MGTKNLEAEIGTNARTHSKITTFALFAAVTIWTLWTGYYKMFSAFGGWDDEGYLMMTVKQFLNGDTLYAEIWTLYGPAYYVYKWLIHGFFNLPNTHAINKLTTLLMWTLIALLGGLFTYRLTRSPLSGAAAQALIFLALYNTAWTAAHPQELCGVLIVTSLLLMPGDNKSRGFNLRLILIGASLAGVVLTKTNIGIFFCLAFAITFAAFTTAGRLQRLMLIALTLAAAMLPFVLFRKHLAASWFELAVLVATALIGTLIVGLMENNRAVFSLKHHALVALSAIAATILTFLFTMPNSSPSVLLDGLVLTPLMKFSGVFTPAGELFYRFTIIWAGAAVLTAAAILFFSKRKPRQTEIAVLFLQLTFGLSIVLALLIGYYTAVTRVVEKITGASSITAWAEKNQAVGHFIILNFATPFLWLLVVKQIGKQEFSADFARRAALAVTAILLTLQLYPVPGGSQIAIATFLMVIAGVVCLCDGFKGFKALFPKPFGQPRLYTGLVMVAVLIMIVTETRRTYRIREQYNSRFSLNLLGSERVRLSEQEVAGYNFITHNIKFNCDSFVSMPSLLSFNFWAEKETPTTLNLTTWTQFLDDSEQRLIVEKLKTSRSGCAVHSPRWAQWFVVWFQNTERLKSSPLFAYISGNYTTVGTVNGYEFMRHNGVTEELVYAARILPDERNAIEFVLPPKFDLNVHRIELFDVSSQRSISDSRTNNVVITDGQGEAVDFPLLPLGDENAARRYKLHWSHLNSADLVEPKNLVLRLYDKENGKIAHLPFPVN